MKYDVIILATTKNLGILRIMLPYCHRNIVDLGKIKIISSIVNKDKIDLLCPGAFVDEDSVLDGLTFSKIRELIQFHGGDVSKTGWYFQQFLKLAWAYQSNDDDYITIDADTIPLSSLRFKTATGKYVFTKKTEYNKPYFETINKLFNEHVKKVGDFSFVAEHMIFSARIVREMLNVIMSNSSLRGISFYEKILFAIGTVNLKKSGFSEFETYGNYIMTYYPDRCVTKTYRTQREAVYILGSKPTDSQLDWAHNSYDIISIEVNDYGPTPITILTKVALFRKLISMKTLSRMRFKLRSQYRRIINKNDFVIEENL